MDQTNDLNAAAEPNAPSPSAVAAFWARAQRAVPELQSAGDCQWRWIGLDAPTTRQIFDLIRAGDKTGTFSLPWLVARGERPPPQVGDCLVLVDYDGTPTLLVRTRRVHTVAFGDMTNEDTAVDGSPVRDIAVWRPPAYRVLGRHAGALWAGSGRRHARHRRSLRTAVRRGAVELNCLPIRSWCCARRLRFCAARLAPRVH